MVVQDEKAGVTPTTTSVPEEKDRLHEELQHIEESGGFAKPGRDLAAAIWTIVCGVGIPCLPVILISGVLLYFIFHNRIETLPGYPELEFRAEHVRQHMNTTQRVSDLRHHGGEPAYYVRVNPSTITTIASWTGRVIPYLSSSIMALVAFFAARRIVTKSKRGDGSDLPTPEQITLLIGLLGGNDFGPLKDTLLHRYANRKKLADPLPMAAFALFIVIFAAILVPIVDSWFGIATTPSVATQLYNHSGVVHSFGRGLSTYCTDGGYNTTGNKSSPGGFIGLGGLEWLSCNLDVDFFDDSPPLVAYLRGPEEATRLTQASTQRNVISNFTDLTGTKYQYLTDPGIDGKLDFKANTFAISSQCRPITRRCLPGAKWPDMKAQYVGAPSYREWFNFTCSPGFQANFSFSGAVQNIDAGADTPGGVDSTDFLPYVGMAFAPDHNLSSRVGQFYNLTPVIGELEQQLSIDPQSPLIGSNWSYQYLLPKNPLDFAVWASGYPALDLLETGPIENPLLNDHEIYSDVLIYWVLGCSATVYDVTYTWVNGSVHTFDALPASPEMGGLISAPFAFQLGPAAPALNKIADLAGTQNSSTALAESFAEGWSQAALALSVGVLDPAPNIIEQVRNSTIPVARVPMIPLYLLLGLKAIYVIAVIALAIGAYCFTHPAETEVVKAQLSAKGLAAAHFDDPSLLQRNVVKELHTRMQAGKEGTATHGEPKQGVHRSKTTPAASGSVEADSATQKRVGIVAQADGAWKFALVADGVWQSVKPIAVSMLTMQPAAGQMGTAGQVIKAWK